MSICSTVKINPLSLVSSSSLSYVPPLLLKCWLYLVLIHHSTLIRSWPALNKVFLESYNENVKHGFSKSVLLTRPENSFLWRAIPFHKTSGLPTKYNCHFPALSSNPIVTTKNIYRHYQMTQSAL